MTQKRKNVTRRKFLAGAVAGATAAAVAHAGEAAVSHQATGVKVGEVSENSAIVWMRLTDRTALNAKGRLVQSRGKPLPADVRIADLRGACPGAAGRVRLRYGTNENLTGAATTDWTEVTARTDFTHQFRLTGLKPGTVYHYAAETSGPGGKPAHAALRGRFETAPPADRFADVLFTSLSCQGYRDLDHAEGYHIYPAMQQLQPKFFVPTGDNVYFDNDDFPANTIALARHHWHRMHGLPRHVAFHLRCPGYWEKDDHDTLLDDCWPGHRGKIMLPLTFADGLNIFREQVPMGENTYRTARWGQGLQVWMVEGRDFRTPNTQPDGPKKSIWGAAQKQWQMRTLLASNATYKILISPTPIVGPDRAGKRDNHANVAFQHEGDEIRAWFQKNLPTNFFVICGDRHWQYHSVHPRTGLNEFGTGAASDAHAGGTPGENKKIHRFHRVRGGFLSVAVTGAGRDCAIVFKHHDVNGKVVYEFRPKR